MSDDAKLFRYCEATDHPMADSYCQGKPHPQCATCKELLWPAESVTLPDATSVLDVTARRRIVQRIVTSAENLDEWLHRHPFRALFIPRAMRRELCNAVDDGFACQELSRNEPEAL